jgi:prevent-host-death family protein
MSNNGKSLENWIWDAAKYKEFILPEFILPLIFTKRLCDVFDDELNRIAKEVGSRAKAFKLVKHDKKLVRFYLPLEPKKPDDAVWSVSFAGRCRWRRRLRYTANWLTSSREARMKTVGAFQAKTQLSQLLDEVEKGEAVTITRHGRPVAVLAPVESARPAKTGEEWLAEVKRLRKGITLGGTVTIRQLIDEGRKY